MDTVANHAHAMERPGLPVMLVTGFLGAGKTTLLNYILANSAGLRAAVFVNEFGSVEIDSSLIRWQSSIDEDSVITLDNGCICCEVNSDLAGQLRRVLRERGAKLDMVIIETSGICDPGPVLSTLEQLDGLAVEIHLDCVLAVADATSYKGQGNPDDAESVRSPPAVLGLEDTARSQIAHSDIVLLNKCGLLGGVDSEATSQAETALLQLLLPPPTGVAAVEVRLPPRVIRTDFAVVDLSLITGLVREPSAQVPAKRQRLCLATSRSHAGSGGLRAQARSFVYEASAPFDPLKFEEWIENGGLPRSICRAKGLLWMRGMLRHVIFQLAGSRTNPFETVKGGGVPSGSRIVFIGEASALRDGVEEGVKLALDACLC